MRGRLLGLGALVTVGVVLLLALVRSSPLWVINDVSTLWVVPVALGVLSAVLVAYKRLPLLVVAQTMIMSGLCTISALLIVRGAFFPFSVMIQAGFLLLAVVLGALLGLAFRKGSPAQ